MRGDHYGDGNRYRGKTVSENSVPTIDLSCPTIDLPCARCGETATVWLADVQYTLKDGTLKTKTKCLCQACRLERESYRDFRHSEIRRYRREQHG